VEHLDGHGRGPQRVTIDPGPRDHAEPLAIGPHGIERRERDEWTEEFATAGEELAGHARRRLERRQRNGRVRRKQTVEIESGRQFPERSRSEQARGLAEQGQVVSDRNARTGHAEQAEDPLDVDRRGSRGCRAPAVRRFAGRGRLVRDGGDGQRECRQHAERLLEIAEPGNAQHAVILAGYERADRRHGPGRRLDGPAGVTGRRPERRDAAARTAGVRRTVVTGPTLLRRRAVGQEQKPPALRHGSIPPIFGDDGDHRPAHVFRTAAGATDERLRMTAQTGRGTG